MGGANGLALALAVALAASLPYACGDASENGPRPATTTAAGGTSGGEKDGGTSASGGTTDAGGPIPTEEYVPPCAICQRAENCCRAGGNTDCDYVAACLAAPASEQQQFYVALCRAMIEASRTGATTTSDVCGA